MNLTKLAIVLLYFCNFAKTKTKLRYSMEYNVFAVGLGIIAENCIFYEKVFIQTEQNKEAVQDFLRIVHCELNYSGGNQILCLANADLINLEYVFTNTNHKGSADFMAKIQQKGKENAFICVMETNEPPSNLQEAYLILQLFSNGSLNSLDPAHRHPLTKIFAALPTIEMSIAGIPGEEGSNDKFPSWLLFNDLNENRFAPTSFVRFGAHLGRANTLMFGATVNMGTSIGDENLLDGHCSIASCVQIGHRNKIGSFVSMEGVLSPVNEHPVVVGDNNFFGTRCRIGTGMIIGNNNFWGSGVDISKGTPLRDFRDNLSTNYGDYVKAGTPDGIQGQHETMIIINRAKRIISEVEVLPGEYLLFNNSEENMKRFERNDDLTSKN